MKFIKGRPRPRNSGRRKGTRNKRTATGADALDFLRKVMESEEATVTLEQKLRAAVALASYQHFHPKPLHYLGEAVVLPALTCAADAPAYVAALIALVAEKRLDFDGAQALKGLVDSYLAALDLTVVEEGANELNGRKPVPLSPPPH